MIETESPNEQYRSDEEIFFDHALCGFLIADADGIILKGNERIINWLGTSHHDLKGKRFSDLLTIGGKIYYETHLGPLLHMQGSFDEVLVELNITDGKKMQVLINAAEIKDKNERVRSIYFTIIKATDRLQYEKNLQHAKAIAEKELAMEKETVALREQLIAVLGHDLRNPLSAIAMAVELIQDSSLNAEDAILADTIKRSSRRMSELINNIMDFARTRLGEGILLKLCTVELVPVLKQVIRELQLIYPNRAIISTFTIEKMVHCDPDRIAQLFSNLLANALMHGYPTSPVIIYANDNNGVFQLSVSNSGTPIPESLQESLFNPFTREGSHKSQNGLGLGLYIAAEIARAHNAILKCISSVEETKFIFTMDAFIE